MRSFLRDAASGKSSKICFKLLSISLSRSAFGTGVDHARNGLKLERGERKIDAAPLVDNILELRGAPYGQLHSRATEGEAIAAQGLRRH